MWIKLSVLCLAYVAYATADAATDYNEVNSDGSYAFGLSNDDIGGHYHTASGSADKIVRGRYGSRNPASGRVEETVYTAGPRGFRARGPQIHRKMDLTQYPRGPIGSPDDPLADPYDDPSYSFSFKGIEHDRTENADSTGRVRGLYSYLDDIGERHTVRYAAGAGTGFQVLNSVPDTPASVAYNAPLYKAPARTRGRMSVQRGLDGQYKFILSGPDQRRSESSGPDGIVRGSYSYLDDKGIQRTVQYIAGAGIGYRIVQSTVGPGTHLAPRPAIPEFGIRDVQSNDLPDDGYLHTAESGRIRPKDDSLDDDDDIPPRRTGGSGAAGGRPNALSDRDRGSSVGGGGSGGRPQGSKAPGGGAGLGGSGEGSDGSYGGGNRGGKKPGYGAGSGPSGGGFDDSGDYSGSGDAGSNSLGGGSGGSRGGSGGLGGSGSLGGSGGSGGSGGPSGSGGLGGSQGQGGSGGLGGSTGSGGSGGSRGGSGGSRGGAGGAGGAGGLAGSGGSRGGAGGTRKPGGSGISGGSGEYGGSGSIGGTSGAGDSGEYGDSQGIRGGGSRGQGGTRGQGGSSASGGYDNSSQGNKYGGSTGAGTSEGSDGYGGSQGSGVTRKPGGTRPSAGLDGSDKYGSSQGSRTGKPSSGKGSYSEDTEDGSYNRNKGGSGSSQGSGGYGSKITSSNKGGGGGSGNKGGAANVYSDDDYNDFPLVSVDHKRLENDREKDWTARARDSTIVKNVGRWYIGLPPGAAVRAHVQNIDLLPLSGRIPSPSEALRRDAQGRK